jgi:hypothetical protein
MGTPGWKGHWDWAGKGNGWNHLDQLSVCMGKAWYGRGLTPSEQRAQISLWAIMASPMIVSVDTRVGSIMYCKAPHFCANKVAIAWLWAKVKGPMRPDPRLLKILFKMGSVSSRGGHFKPTRTRICKGKGLEVALRFLEKAVGTILSSAGVSASKTPNRSQSVTLNKNMVDPGTICDAAALMWAGNPKSPSPRHSSMVSEEHPKIKPGPGIIQGHASSCCSFAGHGKSSSSFSGANFDDVMFSSFVSNIRHTSHLPIHHN